MGKVCVLATIKIRAELKKTAMRQLSSQLEINSILVSIRGVRTSYRNNHEPLRLLLSKFLVTLLSPHHPFHCKVEESTQPSDGYRNNQNVLYCISRVFLCTTDSSRHRQTVVILHQQIDNANSSKLECNCGFALAPQH